MHFTQNPIGSDDQLDLQDNAISFDYAMNSPAAIWTDRFGKQHKTVQQALKDVGFKPAGFDFVSGGTLGIGDRDKCVFYPTDGYWYSWNGKLPYAVPANSSPAPGGKKGWGVIGRCIDATLRFDTVEEMQGFKGFSLGQKVSTGATVWKIVDTAGLNLDRDLFAIPLNGIHAVDYGIVGDGITDDTLLMQRALDDSLLVGRSLILPPMKIGVTSLYSYDAFDYRINSNSCELVGIATSLTGSILVLKDWVQSTIEGHLTFKGNIHYNECFWLKSSETTKGTRNNAFYNFTTRGTKVGVRIGQSENERQNSENTFYNLNSYQCPIHVRIGGVQTGASFSGCYLFGQPNPDLPGHPLHAIWMEGGFCTVNGGEVLTTQSNTHQCLLLQPSNPGALYPGSYPQLSIVGAHIETASPLAAINNPFGHAAVPGGRLSVIGCQGYTGDSIGNANWIDAAPDFAGMIQVKTNNFYAGKQRNAFNVSCGPMATLDLNKSSFGTNFRDWMGGANGGKLLHSMETILVVSGSSETTYKVGVKTPLVFGLKANQAKYTRYGPCYNLLTGVFTVPEGGFSNLSIEASFIANPLSGSLFIEVDGVQTAYGNVGGISANISTTLTSLSHRSTVVVYFQASGSDVKMIPGSPNRIIFTASVD